MVAYPQSPVLALQAATPAAGFALQNGTPTILTWTAPNDGNLHRFAIYGNTVITSTETGGAIHITWTPPTAGSSTSAGTDSGGTAAGIKNWTVVTGIVAAGTTVTLSQSSALTAGAATAFAEIWGS